MGKTEELGKNVVIRFCLQEINECSLGEKLDHKKGPSSGIKFSTFKSGSKRIREFCYRPE